MNSVAVFNTLPEAEAAVEQLQSLQFEVKQVHEESGPPSRLRRPGFSFVIGRTRDAQLAIEGVEQRASTIFNFERLAEVESLANTPRRPPQGGASTYRSQPA